MQYGQGEFDNLNGKDTQQERSPLRVLIYVCRNEARPVSEVSRFCQKQLLLNAAGQILTEARG